MTKKLAAVKRQQLDVDKYKCMDLMAPPAGILWSSGGERLAVWSKGGKLAILDENGECSFSWQAHRGQILSASWSRDGTLIATAGCDGICRVWTLQGIEVATLNHSEGWVDHVKWSPHADVLVTACSAKLRLWSQSGALVDELSGHRFPVTDVRWHPVQKDILVSCAGDGICAWKLGYGEPVHHLQPLSYPEHLCFSPTGSILAFGCGDGSVHVWTMGSGIVLKLAGHSNCLNALEWSCSGDWLAFCGDFEVFRWRFNQNAARSTMPEKLVASFGRLRRLQFHDCYHLLACGDEDGSVYVWRTDGLDRNLPIAMNHSNSSVVDIAWSPAARLLAVAYKSGEIKFWRSDFTS